MDRNEFYPSPEKRESTLTEEVKVKPPQAKYKTFFCGVLESYLDPRSDSYGRAVG